MIKFRKIILLLSLLTIFTTACSKQNTLGNSIVDNSKQLAVTTDLDTSESNDTTEFATFTVTKYCSSCSSLVKSNIENVTGVKKVIIDLDDKDNTKGIVKVTFDETKTDINKIKQSVLDLGFGIE